jgi:hypothetical protein
MDGLSYKYLIYIIIIILACIITIFTFDSWQTLCIVALLLISISYVFILALDKLTTLNCGKISEGFVTESQSESAAAISKYEWLSNDDLFDDFYASVFTKLTQNDKLIQAESAFCMEKFTKTTPKD